MKTPLLVQDEVEEAMLQAARDRVENLMQVVEKMQGEQGKLSTSLQAEKRKVATVSSRLPASPYRGPLSGPCQIDWSLLLDCSAESYECLCAITKILNAMTTCHLSIDIFPT